MSPVNKSGIFLLLGSNEGDRAKHLEQACSAILDRVGSIVSSSKIYRTAAWGKTDQNDFFNQVVEINTVLLPQELLEQVLLIEKLHGRVRGEKWGARIIDIDILLYHDLIIDDENLTVPHPGIAERKFTLVPLNEIAPNLPHPRLRKNISQLLLECSDPLPVAVA